MRTALVKMPVATATLNVGVDAVNGLVQSGALLWVFDLAANPRGQISSPRFYFPELEARAKGDSKSFADYDLARIVTEILPPNRSTWPAGAVDQLFQISRPTRISLHRDIYGTQSQSRPARANRYPRGPLADFLERRWLGNFERNSQ